MDLKFYKEKLEEAGVDFAPGLTDSEARRAEAAYDFRFPPDLEEFLRYALPVSKGWPDWRELEERPIVERLRWPLIGILFDIENNAFWHPDWGTKPGSLEEAFAVAERKVEEAPKLIPIASHRYLPERPRESCNPVFSVYQTDIIYYGSDLANYLENEFSYYFGKSGYGIPEPIKRIEFWSAFAEEEI